MPERLVVIFAFLLIQSPSLVSDSDWAGLLRVLLLLPFWAVVITRLIIGPTLRASWRQRLSISIRHAQSRPLAFGAVGLLICFTLADIARAFVAGTIQAGIAREQFIVSTTLFLFAFTVFLWPRSRESYEQLVRDIFLGLALFIVASVVLDLLGVSASAFERQTRGTTTQLLSLIGISVQRRAFVLGSGLNGFGAAAGACLAAWLILFIRKPGGTSRVLSALFVVAGAYCLLLTDSRSAFFTALLCVSLAVLVTEGFLGGERWITTLLPLLPFVLLPITILFSVVLSDNVSRSSDDISTLGNRIYVWRAVGTEFSNFRFAHLFGFGLFGQVTSGVSSRFGKVVGAGYETQQLSAHNALLQYVLDSGYIGAAVFLFVCWSALSRLPDVRSRQASSHERLLRYLIVYVLLTGITQVDGTIYIRETFILFVFLLAASFGKSVPLHSIGRFPRLHHRSFENGAAEHPISQ